MYRIPGGTDHIIVIVEHAVAYDIPGIGRTAVRNKALVD